MYEVDSRDEVIELKELPQSSVGAPIPIVLADEFKVILAYYLEDGADQNRPKETDPSHESIAIVRFNSVTSHMFGPPNDEAFSGHPLAKRGLQPYSAFRVDQSSWIRRLERMNSVHPYHDPSHYKAKQHFIFAFHDSTFECVCKDFELKIVYAQTVSQVIPTMVTWLQS